MRNTSIKAALHCPMQPAHDPSSENFLICWSKCLQTKEGLMKCVKKNFMFFAYDELEHLSYPWTCYFRKLEPLIKGKRNERNHWEKKISIIITATSRAKVRNIHLCFKISSCNTTSKKERMNEIIKIKKKQSLRPSLYGKYYQNILVLVVIVLAWPNRSLNTCWPNF